MNQVLITCTSGTRPGSPVQGMHIYETDTNLMHLYNGTSWCCLTPQSATVVTSQTTASTTYTDLATVGPAVTVATGTKALVTIGASFAHGSTNGIAYMAPAVSSATTLAASDNLAAVFQAYVGTAQGQFCNQFLITGLTGGSNIFTAKYRTPGGTATYALRWITVVAIP